ncbi:MAG: SGNH/GDSL hydrolase family protein [Candidatus Nanopelagicales bacterium]
MALLTLVTGLGLLLTACGTAVASSTTHNPTTSVTTVPSTAPPPTAAATPHAPPRAEVLLALGDSVPAGNACGCETYVSLIAAQMASRTGISITARNDAVSGLDSAGLLASLGIGSPTAADVARANVVIITIGANDFSVPPDGARCGAATSCYSSGLAALAANVSATITRIRAIRPGPPATVVLTGYWNVWQDGTVAAQMGARFVQLSRAITSATNDVLRQVARSHGVRYVDLVQPFLGPRGDADDTNLLAPDGDHPDATGHQVIAAAILQAVPSLLQRPA